MPYDKPPGQGVVLWFGPTASSCQCWSIIRAGKNQYCWLPSSATMTLLLSSPPRFPMSGVGHQRLRRWSGWNWRRGNGTPEHLCFFSYRPFPCQLLLQFGNIFGQNMAPRNPWSKTSSPVWKKNPTFWLLLASTQASKQIIPTNAFQQGRHNWAS